jgi:hypothetical protein
LRQWEFSERRAYLGTGGIVAPHTKQERQHRQIIAAIQGATPEQVRKAGGRYDFDGVVGLPAASAPEAPAPRPDTKEAPAPRPDTKYVRAVKLRGALHRVPLAADGTNLPCWSCGEMHEKPGSRFKTTDLRWDRPEDQQGACANN